MPMFGLTCAGPCSVYYLGGVDSKEVSAKALIDYLATIEGTWYSKKTQSGLKMLFAVALTFKGQQALEKAGFGGGREYVSNTNEYYDKDIAKVLDLGMIDNGYGDKIPWRRHAAKFYVLNYKEWLEKYEEDKKKK